MAAVLQYCHSVIGAVLPCRAARLNIEDPIFHAVMYDIITVHQP